MAESSFSGPAISDRDRTLTRMSEVTEGFDWLWPRVTEEERLAALWQNQRLGYDQREKGGVIRLNWFRRISSFWVGALWGEDPRIRLGGTPIAGALRDALAYEFGLAQRDRSRFGKGVVLIRGDGSPLWVDTRFYHEVVDVMDRTRVKGHVIGYLWWTQDDAMPNMIDVLKIEDDGALRETYELQGFTLGKLQRQQPVDVARCVTFGDWVSDFWDAEDVVAAIENRMIRLDRALDRLSNPHMQGPQGAQLGDSAQAFEDGLYMPREGEDAPYAYVTPAEALYQWHFQQLTELRDELNIMTSVPISVFGTVSQSRGSQRESGLAKERSMYAALQKVRLLRRETAMALRVAVGDSEAVIDWPDDPFADYAERADAIAKLRRVEVEVPDIAARLFDL